MTTVLLSEVVGENTNVLTPLTPKNYNILVTVSGE